MSKNTIDISSNHSLQNNPTENQNQNTLNNTSINIVKQLTPKQKEVFLNNFPPELPPKKNTYISIDKRF